MKLMEYLVLCSILVASGLIFAKEKKEKTPVTHVVITEEKNDQIVVVAPTVTVDSEDRSADDTEGQQSKRILTTFLSMLGNFATLLSDPKNPNVVGAQIAQILSGMLAIAMEAFNKSQMTENKQDLEHVELDDAFIAELKARFIEYADKLKLAYDC